MNRLVFLSAIGVWFAHSAVAQEAAPEPAVNFEVHGAVTYGMAVRTSDRKASLMTPGNAAAIGEQGTATAGRNSDDGNLNYEKNDTISRVLKGVFSASLTHGSRGALARAKYWHDFALENDDRPWGNAPNHYQANAPLDDSDFARRARFVGWALQDAYIYDTWNFSNQTLHVRLGQQNIPWGIGWQTQGGLSVLTPLDLPAVNRPGAVPEEVTIPYPALYSSFAASDAVRIEGFYQIRFRPSELNGCGTFFSAQDYNAEGCNFITLAGASDRVAVAGGLIGTRASTPDVSDDGQFGISGSYRFDNGVEIGGYAARYHSRWTYTGAVRSTRTTVPFVPNNPDGRNAQYLTEHPEGIRLFAITVKTPKDGFNAATEVSYSPNQPVQLNATDLLNAFSSNTAPSLLRSEVAGTGYGSVFHGYDRLRVAQVLLAGGYAAKQGLGGQNLNVQLEVGLKHVFDLPDQSVRRYGRSDMYGVGPINGACTGSPEQCSFDGYVSSTAYGYRLRTSITYPAVLEATDITPSLSWGEDVKGWSYDSVYNEGRKVGSVSVRATYKKAFWALASWHRNSGGSYNNMRDRSYASIAIGARF